MASKAVEAQHEPSESHPPPIIANNTPKSKVNNWHFIMRIQSNKQNNFVVFFFKPNGTKSKKPSAQREHKNADTNAGQTANADASMENNIKSHQITAVTQHQTINKPAQSQPILTQSSAMHQVCHTINAIHLHPLISWICSHLFALLLFSTRNNRQHWFQQRRLSSNRLLLHLLKLSVLIQLKLYQSKSREHTI